MARILTIYNSKTNATKVDHRTNANTWEELAAELTRDGLYSPDLIAMCKEDRTEFTKGTTLPSQRGLNGSDFTLFLVPTKNKAGKNIKKHNSNDKINAQIYTNLITGKYS